MSTRAAPNGGEIRTIQTNPRARRQFDLLEVIEAGIALTGPEVKSLREGKVSLAEAYARIEQGEAWLVGMHIAPYAQAGYAVQEPKRRRKLLLRRAQIRRWEPQVRQKGITIIPVRIYFKRGLVKVELALARGRRGPDKREAIRAREVARDLARRRRRAR